MHLRHFNDLCYQRQQSWDNFALLAAWLGHWRLLHCRLRLLAACDHKQQFLSACSLQPATDTTPIQSTTYWLVHCPTPIISAGLTIAANLCNQKVSHQANYRSGIVRHAQYQPSKNKRGGEHHCCCRGTITTLLLSFGSGTGALNEQASLRSSPLPS